MAKNFKKTATEQAPVYGKLLGEAEPQLKGQMRITDSGEIQEEQEAQNVHEVQDAQEVQPISDKMQTQGKKGAKLPRINMAFSPANHEFITIMSRLGGLTMTEYVNRLIDAEREANADKIEQAKSLFNMLEQ